MKQKALLCLLLLLPCLWTNAQNVTVKSFQLLVNDLTAMFQETREIDQNGETAALIKVITTETGFLFDIGALGIVKQVQKPGEIWLYVPHGAMRIKINHQELGRMEEPYYFPIPIKSARTYEMVLTTNRTKNVAVEEDVAQERTPPESTPAKDDIKPSLPQKTAQKPSLFRKTDLYTDAHFLLGTPYVVGVSVGTYLGGFNVEGSIGFALGGKEDVTWYRLVNDIYNPHVVVYTPSPLINGCVGYGIKIGERLRLTPQAGVGVLAISGKSSEGSQRTYIFSGTASLRAEYALTRRLSLYVSPSFSLPLKRGATAERLKEDVVAFSRWNNGFSAQIGFSLNF